MANKSPIFLKVFSTTTQNNKVVYYAYPKKETTVDGKTKYVDLHDKEKSFSLVICKTAQTKFYNNKYDSVLPILIKTDNYFLKPDLDKNNATRTDKDGNTRYVMFLMDFDFVAICQKSLNVEDIA